MLIVSFFVNTEGGRGGEGGLINFPPLKTEGLFERGRGLNRGFTVLLGQHANSEQLFAASQTVHRIIQALKAINEHYIQQPCAKRKPDKNV